MCVLFVVFHSSIAFVVDLTLNIKYLSIVSYLKYKYLKQE